MTRELDWEGGVNVRDLGGLPAADGRVIRHGALVRAGTLDNLTEAGWVALHEHGVRTVVDLRNDDERGALGTPPDAVTVVHVPLDGIDDREFWDVWATGPQFGSPIYYAPFLERFPDRTARVITAIANAQAGGVAYHCMGGRDRTGMITMLLLALAGVEPDHVAADYVLGSHANAADRERLDAFHDARGETAAQIVMRTLESLDVEAYLLDAGVTAGDLRALRERLLSTPGASAP